MPDSFPQFQINTGTPNKEANTHTSPDTQSAPFSFAIETSSNSKDDGVGGMPPKKAMSPAMWMVVVLGLSIGIVRISTDISQGYSAGKAMRDSKQNQKTKNNAAKSTFNQRQ